MRHAGKLPCFGRRPSRSHMPTPGLLVDNSRGSQYCPGSRARRIRCWVEYDRVQLDQHCHRGHVPRRPVISHRQFGGIGIRSGHHRAVEDRSERTDRPDRTRRPERCSRSAGSAARIRRQPRPHRLIDPPVHRCRGRCRLDGHDRGHAPLGPRDPQRRHEPHTAGRPGATPAASVQPAHLLVRAERIGEDLRPRASCSNNSSCRPHCRS